MRIITISREFGSGGRELGKRLADELGFAYYDREIVTEIAKRASLDENYVDSVLEKGAMNISITYSSTMSHVTAINHAAASILREQQKIISELAAKGDCVIVGRNADIILEQESPLKIFVHADMESKIKRCYERAASGEALTERQMKSKIKKIDKGRYNRHALLSAIPWGDKRGYNMCVNTTNMEIKSLVPAVAEFAKAWFGKE
ncbi:MAG: cytidylate kinase-like family protein [Oscillospiraceae bacterium]|nr:cytidylate kinase-like family protein [Oscillospiraceae bacterium]